MIVQCCKCERVRDGDRWLPPPTDGPPAAVSHTYCPRCADESYIEIFSTQASRVTVNLAVVLSGCLRTG